MLQVTFVVGEMKDPQYTLPRVLNRSMAIIITLFILANVAFYNTLSQEILEKTNAVAIVSWHSPMPPRPSHLNNCCNS
jgi:amino acid transporter